MSIEFQAGHQALRRCEVAAGRQGRGPAGAQGHADHHPRALGLRQDHAAAHDRRAGCADLRPHPHRRPGRDHARAGRAQRQHGVPELCALPAHERAGQCLLRAGGAGHGTGPGRAACARGDGQRRPGRLRGAAAQRAVRRPAAARGGGALAGAGAFGDAVRRAAVQPGRAAAPQHARGDPRAAAAPGADRGLRDPRPERGTGRQRPDHRHGRRPHRAGRHAAAAVRTPDERVRRRLHGRGHALRRPGAGRRHGAARPADGDAAPAGGPGRGEGGGAARGLAARRGGGAAARRGCRARCRNAPTWAASRR